MKRSFLFLWPISLAILLFLAAIQCLTPYEVPPFSLFPFVPDTTLNDTGIMDGGSFSNPIIPGFHPDPSICRVGQDYYLVNSSFEYFPGIPIFHSRDLVNWRQIGHCLTRTSQLDLNRTNSNGGIAAPTIRYDNGTFYVIVTETGKKGNMFVTAKDPAGPWSEPVYLITDGFDPSLFFDDNGKVYLQSQEGDGRESHIIQYQIDLTTGCRIGQKKSIWAGDGDIWLEGPHLYKINALYYLTAASGGTGSNHHQLIAASNHVFGPYTDCPLNPILSHQGTAEPIQCTGHADMFQDHNGRWWAVFLAVREMNVGYSSLGRETFLAPVLWKKGWPVIGSDGKVSLRMRGPLPEVCSWEQVPARDEFDSSDLPARYVFLRNPKPGSFSLRERPGWLRLHGNGIIMSNQDACAYIGRRQQDFNAVVRVKMEFGPQKIGEEAGLSIRLNEKAHYEIAVIRRSDVDRCMVRSCIGSETHFVDSIDVTGTTFYLQIECSHERYVLSCFSDSISSVTLAELESRPLSMETWNSFTGVVIGMYATGNEKACIAPADFDWMEYIPSE
jgi:xylan 1,4-beta-xylosidase